MARRTTEQRIAAHQEKAAQLAEQLRIRTLRNSPAWKATDKAIEKIDEALLYLAAENALGGEHAAALSAASDALEEIKRKVFAQ